MKLSLIFKLILLILFLPIIVLAQKISGVVSYKYILNFSTNPVVRTAHLHFKDNESIFVHSQGKKGYVNKTSDGKDWDEKDTDVPLTTWYQDTLGVVFFKDLEKKKLCTREFFHDAIYVTEEPRLPNITWQITSEKKSIGSFSCQKATTHFRGRNYTAWFTMDIPISNGPWKLQGLPGLILEATDDAEEVKFLFLSIEMPSTRSTAIKVPTDGKKVDFETYKKADAIEYEKGKRAKESVAAERGVILTITRGKVSLIEKEYEQ